MPSSLRILILGGTQDASALARSVAGDARFAPVLSYAGRTRSPAAQPVPVRIGGFGGAGGLAAWLLAHRTDALVDATHPFAARISANAARAAARAGVPCLHVLRPAWQRQAGDDWTTVPGMEQAVATLGPVPRRVLVTVGGTDLLAFADTPHALWVRTVDPAAHLPTGAVALLARGPFDEAAERDLLAAHGIEALVAKNSGGSATAAKLAAARALGVRVVMVDRPPGPPGETVPDAAGALAWLHHQAALRGL